MKWLVLAVLLMTPVTAVAQNDGGAMDPAADPQASEIPKDIALVVRAVEAALRHDPTGVEGVVFAAGVADAMAEKAFAYQGFSMVDTEITDVADDPDGGGRRLSGSMLFVDRAGRRAKAVFAVGYRHGGFAYVVTEAQASVETISEPRIVFYLLKTADVPEDLTQVAADHTAVLAWLAKTAVRPEATGLPHGDYTVVAAFMDRMPGEVASFLRFYDAGIERQDAQMAVYGYDGWRVVLSQALFAARAGSGLVAKASIQPTLNGELIGDAREVGELAFGRLFK